MVETGFTRPRTPHTMTMNFMVYGIAMLAYWVVGFALQAGGVDTRHAGGYDKLAHEVSITIAGKEWACSGDRVLLTGSRTPHLSSVLPVPDVFMDTAATIRRGAAEREVLGVRVFSVFVGIHLSDLRQLDLGAGGCDARKNSGSGMGTWTSPDPRRAHDGGVMAFVTAALLGPRRGKYNADGTANAIPGHNIPMALVGTFILRSDGSLQRRLDAAGSDLRIGVIATNTMLAGRGWDHIDAVHVAQVRQARSVDDGQRHARRIGGHHGAVCVRDRAVAVLIAESPECWFAWRCSSSTASCASMTPSVRSRARRQRAVGILSSGCWPTARTGRVECVNGRCGAVLRDRVSSWPSWWRRRQHRGVGAMAFVATR